MKQILTLSVIIFFTACTGNGKRDVDNTEIDSSVIPISSGIAAPKALTYVVISQYPHDTSSFTEGLELHNGKLFESGGDYESSRLQYGNYKNGLVEKVHKMGTDKIFGEGITILKNKIYQLTYQTHIGYVYDLNDIDKPVKTFDWPYEGWGMTNNGTDLIIDTRDQNLYFVDPETFKIKNTVAVVDDRGPVQEINELEYADGFIWANVWNTNRILKIDPESGHVVADMYLKDIASPEGRLLSGAFANTDVMNGIAYDSTQKKLLITGKRWPKIFEIKVE